LTQRASLPRPSPRRDRATSALVYVGRHANGGRDYFACSRLSGRRSRLGFAGDEICAGWDEIAHFHFVGPFLAFVRSGSYCVGESSYDQLARTDLRSGARTIFHAWTNAGVPAASAL
jgi:hypothetical protein